MKRFTKKSNNKGFSLIELMIVIGIIGILATLAVPRFNSYQAKAKQSEAKLVLRQIHTAQTTYQLEQNLYGAFGDVTPASFSGVGAVIGSTVAPNNCDFSAGAGLAAKQMGFLMGNCQQARFGYAAGLVGTTWRARAITGTEANNKVVPCSQFDQWDLDIASGAITDGLNSTDRAAFQNCL